MNKKTIVFLVSACCIIGCSKSHIVTQEVKANWYTMADFPADGRQNSIAFAIDGKGYVGLGRANGDYRDLWQYDPQWNSWTKKASYPGFDIPVTYFIINTKAYILIKSRANEKSELWEYDPSTNRWNEKTDFPGKNIFYASSFSIGNKGYMVVASNGSTLKKDFWEYDPSKNKWKKRADFPGNPMDSPVGFTIEDKGYFALGNYPEKESKS
ncbi:MAG: Kelch repeat-containing protein, partial [Flavisolibacter sp.]